MRVAIHIVTHLSFNARTCRIIHSIITFHGFILFSMLSSVPILRTIVNHTVSPIQ